MDEYKKGFNDSIKELEKKAQFYTASPTMDNSSLGPLGMDVMNPPLKSSPEAIAPGPNSLSSQDIEEGLGISNQPACECPVCGYNENVEDERVCSRYKCPVCGETLMAATSIDSGGGG